MCVCVCLQNVKNGVRHLLTHQQSEVQIPKKLRVVMLDLSMLCVVMVNLSLLCVMMDLSLLCVVLVDLSLLCVAVDLNLLCVVFGYYSLVP